MWMSGVVEKAPRVFGACVLEKALENVAGSDGTSAGVVYGKVVIAAEFFDDPFGD